MLDLVVSQLKGQGFDTSWYADVSMDQNYFNSKFPFFFFWFVTPFQHQTHYGLFYVLF